ncbi:unnamed protein product [Acanthoscelides obtectus]|uniref:Uncharacterized protein n=1 Tax=Acanthoscelides obtectus TaxID=200917 RepID=A0A9P0Q598_ACAOB|nr:unnamed protein product [Acanthoscelides obtectus]CAK1626269.1 hypothetical protein AOBTE_LOCUS3735 [Acanthoscelides obtectus]
MFFYTLIFTGNHLAREVMQTRDRPKFRFRIRFRPSFGQKTGFGRSSELSAWPKHTIVRSRDMSGCSRAIASCPYAFHHVT